MTGSQNHDECAEHGEQQTRLHLVGSAQQGRPSGSPTASMGIWRRSRPACARGWWRLRPRSAWRSWAS
jgi:hypothetical protein